MNEEASGALEEVEEGLQERFPNLEIEGLVAQGGMGAVYRAVQKQLDRPVALKILPDEFAVDEVRRSLFVHEARAMAKLSHPHLVQLFDFGEADGMWFMVQEWVPGRTLFDHQEIGMLQIDDGVRVVREVCAGLQHAHENGVIHRDVKPANILIDPDGAVKLTDFGLAQTVGGGIQEDDDEGSFGTPEYAAPELYIPGATIDHRTDIFALGVLLFEVLTGEQPSEVYRPPSEVIGDLGTRFDTIVSKAMQHDPENRYPSCAEFGEDLYQALTGAEAEASRPRVVVGQTRGITRPISMTPMGVSSLSSAKAGGGGSQLLGILAGVGILAGAFIFFMKSDDKDGPKDTSADLDQEETLITPKPEPEIVAIDPQPLPEEVVADELEEPEPEKLTSVKKPERQGPIPEVVELENALRKKIPALLVKYDTEMKTLRSKYLTACGKAARGKGSAMMKFWKAEALALKKTGAPPVNDKNIPERALTLRKAWRNHQLIANEDLKLLHFDTIERYDLLLKEFRRNNRSGDAYQVMQRIAAIRSFESFMTFCREQAPGNEEK